MSDTPKGIRAKLAAIVAELHCPKTGEVKDWQGRKQYNYRNLVGIFETIKPLLKKYGCILKITDDVIVIGESITPVFEQDAKGVKHMIAGPHYYIRATATITDVETGESESATSCAREAEYRKGLDPSQQTGSTSSYAGKYAAEHLFCLDSSKDADELAAETPSKPDTSGMDF